MARPSPLPPASRARASSSRTKRSKTRSRSSAAIPAPSSLDREQRAVGGLRRREDDPAARMPGGVVGEVAHDLAQQPEVAAHARPGARPTRRPRPLPGRAGASPRPAAGRRGRRRRRSSARPPSSARVSTSIPCTSRSRRAPSSSTASLSSSELMRSGCARATSAYCRSEASGDLSSCDASDTNRRWTAWDSSSRASIPFIVCASRPISSRVAGSSTRADRSDADIRSTCRRMRSTGSQRSRRRRTTS